MRALVRELAEQMQEYLTVLDGIARERGGTVPVYDEDPRLHEAAVAVGNMCERYERAVEGAYGEETFAFGIGPPDPDEVEFPEVTEWHQMMVEMHVAVRPGHDGGNPQFAIEPHVDRMIADLQEKGWTVGYHTVFEWGELDDADGEGGPVRG
jgi:hypothetical protein